MLRSQNRNGSYVNGFNERVHNLLVAVGMLSVLALFAMVVGPAVSGSSVGASPAHSHVFLTVEAAAAHSHGSDASEALEAGVVNLSNQSADSATGTLHIHHDSESAPTVRFTTTLHQSRPGAEYVDADSPVPDRPPRTS